MSASPSHSLRPWPGRATQRGFTMIELMVVIGIGALLLTTAMPSLYRKLDKDSMQKAVSDLLEACSHARAHAILNGTATALKIRPGERTFSVTSISGAAASGAIGDGGGATLSASTGAGLESASSETGVSVALPPSGNTGVFSFTLSSSIQVEGLGVNGEDWTEDEEVLVRFFPNGTSDEMSIILLSDKGERRNIWLEVVTALAEVETDVAKFRAR